MNSPDLFDKFGKEFEAGSVIFCEFEEGDDFYLIQSGKVKISKIVKDFEKTMDVLEAGDIFGEMAILEKQPRSATAIAVEHVKVLRFNRENFVTLMTSQPQWALKLLIIFSKRIYDAKRRLIILLLDDLQAKVADTFVMLSEKTIDDHNAREANLNVGIEDISHWCAESAEAIQPILDSWVRMGKIEVYNDHIMINNLNDFRRIASSKKKFTLGLS